MKENELNQAIEALTDLIECGGFRLGSKLDYAKCLKTARSILKDTRVERKTLDEGAIWKVINSLDTLDVNELNQAEEVVTAICSTFKAPEITEMLEVYKNYEHLDHNFKGKQSKYVDPEVINEMWNAIKTVAERATS